MCCYDMCPVYFASDEGVESCQLCFYINEICLGLLNIDMATMFFRMPFRTLRLSNIRIRLMIHQSAISYGEGMPLEQ